jgi:cell wall-associated NlpC family hydrolase
MRLRAVAVQPYPHVVRAGNLAIAAALATLLVLLTPSLSRGQAEWNIGPFLTYSTIHGGRPASAGLQTGVFVGPVGLRASGFTALDQPAYGNRELPRWGGDADLMLIFDISSRGSTGVGLAPYVFAGAGLGVHNDTSRFYNPDTYNAANVAGGWSYGVGLLVPIGNTLEAMGEMRQRPAGFFNVSSNARSSRNEFRVGLSLRLGTALGGSRYRGSAVERPRAPRPTRREDARGDPVRIILSGVSDAGGVTTPPASSSRVVPTAERYLGTRYRYGGTSPSSGFDCSGFVQYVFARNAVKLPRTSRQQAKVGTPLRRDWRALAPGDLVMFAERGEAISHVAIYAGKNRIIHATSSGGGVRYDDLSTRRGQWFAEHIVTARRVAPDARGLMLDLVRLLDPKTLADSALDLGDFAPRP